MSEEYRTIYKTARAAAGYTQEAAAERLAVSVESLRAYETAQRVPPNDVVERMVVVYNNFGLAYQHLKETNALVARIVPELQPRELLEVAVRIFNRLNRFTSNNSVERLMTIAEDGTIDQAERVEFDAILSDLREIVRSGLELEVFCVPGSDL